jgi:hypothetical protein
MQISSASDTQWMIPVSMQLVPVSLMIIGLLFLPESPRWLYLKNRRTAAVKALTWVRNLSETHPYIQSELRDYERQMEREEDISSGSGLRIIAKEAFSKQVRPRLFIGCLLQIFLNSTGVNALNYFIVSFFQALGFNSVV